MKLTGIVEDVFVSRTVFRGYATLRTLYKISKTSNYQRKEDEARLPEICNFLENSSFRFFPELLFAWQIEEPNVLTNLKQDQGKIELKNGISIKKAKFTFQQIIGNEPTTKVITINIPEEELLKKPFIRLDGNHRLSALKEIYEQEEQSGIKNELLNMIVPFSVLLQTKGDEAEKYESAFFYLINSKAKSLTTEENLHSILEKDFFTTDERVKLLGVSEIDTLQRYIDDFKRNKYKLISDVFKDNIYTLALRLVSLIKDTDANNIISAVRYIDNCYVKNELGNIINKNILLSLIKVRSDRKFYKNYLSWIQKLPPIIFDNIDPDDIICLYEESFLKKLEIFVAMPYFGKEQIKDYNMIYEEAIKDLNSEYKSNIFLNSIMSNRGEALDLIKDIFEKIKRCDIFFADITGNNPNVTYEMGWARALNKKVVIVKRKDSDRPSSDYEHDAYQEYDDTSRYLSLKKCIKENLSKILENDYYLVKDKK